MHENQQLFQTIIAILIILAAIIFILFKVVKKIKQPVSGCSDCSSDCGGCELTALKKDIDEAQKRKSIEENSSQINK